MNRQDQLIDDPIQSYAAFQRKQRRYRIAIGIVSVIATAAFIASVVLFCRMRAA